MAANFSVKRIPSKQLTVEINRKQREEILIPTSGLLICDPGWITVRVRVRGGGGGGSED